MKVKYRNIRNLIYLQIKKDNETILIINKKYQNKKLECSAKQTSDCTKKQ